MTRQAELAALHRSASCQAWHTHHVNCPLSVPNLTCIFLRPLCPHSFTLLLSPLLPAGSDSSPLPLGCCDATRRRLRVEAQATGGTTTLGTTAAAAAAATAAAANTGSEAGEGDSSSNPHFCLDAKKVGSVARFINHSCSPNLFVQCVFHDHGDERFPHVMLFAYDNIPPLKELTYDYGYVIGSVRDADGREKKLECHCGSAKCRGRLY